MLKAARSFLMILTVLIVAAYSTVPSAIEVCDLGGCSDEMAQLTHGDHDSSANDHSPLNCNCTSHGCYHSTAVMSRHSAPAQEFAEQIFVDHYDFRLLMTYLEGPFQPPKA